MNTVAFILSQFAQHADVLELVISSLADGSLDKEELKKSIKASIEAKYDIQVDLELGITKP